MNWTNNLTLKDNTGLYVADPATFSSFKQCSGTLFSSEKSFYFIYFWKMYIFCCVCIINSRLYKYTFWGNFISKTTQCPFIVIGVNQASVSRFSLLSDPYHTLIQNVFCIMLLTFQTIYAHFWQDCSVLKCVCLNGGRTAVVWQAYHTLSTAPFVSVCARAVYVCVFVHVYVWRTNQQRERECICVCARRPGLIVFI